MNVRLFLVPYDSGRHRWRCGAGPERLVRAGLVDHLRRQGHAVEGVHVVEDDPTHEPSEIRTPFELARRLAVQVRAAHTAGHFSLVLSGNCSSAIGTLSGLSPARRTVFWFDAHGDLNTPETTTSGFMDGMGLAVVTGLAWRRLASSVPGFHPIDARDTYLLGVRDLDPPEAAHIRESGSTLVAVDQLPAELERILSATPRDDGVGYLHLDPDALDPSVGRANYLPVANGLAAEQLTATVAAIRARVSLSAACVASYSPEDDRDQAVARVIFAAIDAMLTAAPRVSRQ